MSTHRGPVLPYTVVAGITPWGRRWVCASAKVSGSVFAPEPPKIYESFQEILDEHPSFQAIVVNAPIGYRDDASEARRTCDLEARALLGRRARALRYAPTRGTLFGETVTERLDAASRVMLPSLREVAAEASPYRQRTVFEGSPELSFYQLNGETALRHSKRTEAGRDERRDILVEKVRDIERVLDAEMDGVPVKHVLDASALLWSARRVTVHAARRIPRDAEWDSEGVRMELVF